MRKLITCGLLGFVLLAGRAEAKVIIEVLDPAEWKYLVTYELKASKAHSTEHLFPSGLGLKSKSKILEVVSITEKNTDQEFEYEIIPGKDKDGAPVEGRYKVKAIFINPIPQGGHYILEYRVILYNEEDCFIDKDGRWLFQYETTHDAFFVLPKGHAVVYSNFPVLIYEKRGRTVLQNKVQIDSKSKKKLKRKLIFKTYVLKK